MHATIPKGIVGGFELTVVQRIFMKNGTRDHRRYVCECSRKATKVDRFDTYSVKKRCINYIPYYPSGFSGANFFPRGENILGDKD